MESKTHIKAMALLHQKLYQNEHLDTINIKTYIQELFEVFAFMRLPDIKEVETQLNCPELYLDIDTAVPVGLMISEFITNSYKYAFPKHEHPKLSINLEEKTIGQFELYLADNGPGLPKDFDWSKSKSMGMRLMNSLALQLFGSISYENTSDWSAFTIQFQDTERRKINQ